MEKSRHGAFVHIQKVLKCSLFLFLLINLLSISLDISASTTLLEQKYTLNLSFKDARLEQVLDAIMKQSGVKIAYIVMNFKRTGWYRWISRLLIF